MNEPIQLNVSDYTDTPGPRYIWQGPFSGQHFYETCLKPAFEKARGLNVKLIVNFDGSHGHPVSFLDQSFGTLSEEFGCEEVLSRLDLRSEDSKYVVDDVKGYIRKRYA